MAFTELKVTKKIRWNISDFRKEFENYSNRILSDKILIPYNKTCLSWYMTVSQNSSEKNWLSLFLRLETAKKEENEEFSADSTFTLLTEKGKEVRRLSSESKGSRFDDKLGCPTFVTIQDIYEHVEYGSGITIICDLLIYGPKKQNEGKTSVSLAPKHKVCFNEMLQDEIFCDLHIKTNDGVTLKAHKVILAANSPVFRKMLTLDMKEAKTNTVEIDDFDSKTFRELLRYIYYEEVEDFETHAKSLIYAAEKYELTKLKEKCIEEISSTVTNQNVIEALIIADQISGCEKILKACASVIYVQKLRDPKMKELSKDMLIKLMTEFWNVYVPNDVQTNKLLSMWLSRNKPTDEKR